MSSPHLAWFSPVPPIRSGISAYTAEILPALAADHVVDVFVDGTSCRPLPPTPAGARTLLPAHAFVSRHTLAPYDLVVYQLGNAACHDYMWPYLVRYPGLVVLHDAALHHSRARSLLARGRRDDYRAEFRYAHPDARPELAEFAVAGFAGAPYYLWPMTRVAITAARLLAVHSPILATDLAAESPAPVAVVRMGVRDPLEGTQSGVASAAAADERPAASSSRAPSPEPRAPVFACFGLVTPEKRIPQVLAAFAPLARSLPSAGLLLVGEVAGYYDVEAAVAGLGLQEQVTIAGFVPDAQLDARLVQADVCLCLRWPTARETSASWLRCLAAGKATVITDLAHTTDVPLLDPRSWTLAHARRDAAAASVPPGPRQAVAVGIDILDEDHSLGLAMRRLATDSALREQLGRNGRAHWAAGHTVTHMADDYRRVIRQAIGQPPRAAAPDGWPAHLLDDGDGLVRQITEPFGVEVDI
jgi:glycosyltransferase involved in cell wall biosynthesis